jgi:hypothetical protein
MAHLVFKKLSLEAMSDIVFSLSIEPQLYHVIKTYEKPFHIRQSIIARCKVQGADKFNKFLSDKTGIKIEKIPHHLTLYTLPDFMSRKGISLITEHDFKMCAQPIDAKTILQTVSIF